jgi:hypothetical protein
MILRSAWFGIALTSVGSGVTVSPKPCRDTRTSYTGQSPQGGGETGSEDQCYRGQKWGTLEYQPRLLRVKRTFTAYEYVCIHPRAIEYSNRNTSHQRKTRQRERARRVTNITQAGDATVDSHGPKSPSRHFARLRTQEWVRGIVCKQECAHRRFPGQPHDLLVDPRLECLHRDQAGVQD